jgi:hypothetical protein
MEFGVENEYSLGNIFSLSINPTAVFWLVGLVLFFIILNIVLRLIRNYVWKNRYFDHAVFLIKLPKEKPGEAQKEMTTQDLREEIAVGESIFASIGGLRAQRSFLNRFLGRDDHFSFEIVAHEGKIYFYVVAPRSSARFLEQQIHAHYPDALVEETIDYNIFQPHSNIYASVLKTKKSFVFPLKTYGKMEVDPMNAIVNAMSKLGSG